MKIDYNDLKERISGALINLANFVMHIDDHEIQQLLAGRKFYGRQMLQETWIPVPLPEPDSSGPRWVELSLGASLR